MGERLGCLCLQVNTPRESAHKNHVRLFVQNSESNQFVFTNEGLGH